MSNFYTDVIKNSAKFGSMKRVDDMQLLEPETRRKVHAIISDAKVHGVDFMVYETYRSQQRQSLLFDQGATKLRKVGVHHYGLACDIVKSIHGDPSWKGDFSLLGHLAKTHGLIWGGDWGQPMVHHSFVDADHVQRVRVLDQTKLFSGEWYPDINYRP